MQGKIKGKRSIGRRQNSWLKNLRKWFGCTNMQLIRSAISKIKIAVMNANFRSRDVPKDEGYINIGVAICECGNHGSIKHF